MAKAKVFATIILLGVMLLTAALPAMAAPSPVITANTREAPVSDIAELDIAVQDTDQNPIGGAPVYLDEALQGSADASGTLTLYNLSLGAHFIEIDLFKVHRGYALASLEDVATTGGIDLQSSDIDRGKVAIAVDVSASGSLTCTISMREQAEAESWLSRLASQAIPVPGSEQSTADKIPWAGYWWPMCKGETALGYSPHGAPGPLEKYDQYIEAKYGGDSRAKEWELANHYQPGCPTWFGHCHAWAAAAVLEDEPRSSITKEGIIFYVGDLKGLLTECHYSDPVDFQLGTRFNPTNNPSYAYEDVYPNDFTIAIRQWIKDR